MASVHSTIVRNITNFARKYGKHILTKAANIYYQAASNRDTRSQTEFLASHWPASELVLKRVIEEEKWIGGLAEKIGYGDAVSNRNKLICAVFNKMTKEMQALVMEGPRAQISYLIEKCGLEKTRELVEKIRA